MKGNGYLIEWMVGTLQRLGYRVVVPADCRRAGPWQNTSQGRRATWSRLWNNSKGEPGTAVAAHLQYTGDGWTWYVRLADNSYKGGPSRVDGRSSSPEEAMRQADEALERLLMESRAARLAAFAGEPRPTEAPQGDLGLPAPGDPPGLELP